jgi:hypothetical protein
MAGIRRTSSVAYARRCRKVRLRVRLARFRSAKVVDYPLPSIWVTTSTTPSDLSYNDVTNAFKYAFGDCGLQPCCIVINLTVGSAEAIVRGYSYAAADGLVPHTEGVSVRIGDGSRYLFIVFYCYLGSLAREDYRRGPASRTAQWSPVCRVGRREASEPGVDEAR